MLYEEFVKQYEELVRKALVPMTHKKNLELSEKFADLVDANVGHERRYEANLFANA